MLDILSLTIPIFLLIALGFVATRSRIMSKEQIQGLSVFVLYFALPALIIHALSGQDLRETFNGNFILAYAGGSLVVFLGVLAFLRFVLRRPLSGAAIGALGGSSSNTGFIGFPVAQLSVGAVALTALPLIMVVENLLIIPLALLLGEIGLHSGNSVPAVLRQTLIRLSRTPLLIAIFIGVILASLQIELPGVVTTAVDMVANASAPVALFVVGGLLANLEISSGATDVPVIAIGKLILHPLAVAGGFYLLGGIPADLMVAGIICASVPMLAVYPILGQRFGMGDVCAAALLATTVAGFVTVTVTLGIVLP